MRRRPVTVPPILYEDNAIIVFDKPAGLLVAPDRWDKTIANLIQAVHAEIAPDIFNIHRLDQDTSGVLVCARTRPALERLCRDFEERTVRKRYEALVRGAPDWEETTVDLPIAPSESEPCRMRSLPDVGKPARTDFKVLKRWRGYARVEAVPLTGRTHQIRVHLASLRCPVVADATYGSGRGILLSELKRNYKFKKNVPEKPLIGRLALHAESITIRHPESGATMTLQSPLPHDFNLAIKYLDRFAASSLPVLGAGSQGESTPTR